ncbi:uncharacterized protein LOC122637318 [Vespula pensylvanica]|uniref:uncharacterized protein LOC122637318 n=1 Tax=Vespula pensylvanica TaxID=30213 RepID=UPI001CBA2D73|nr:uncharacterized protein LOC122637318 [Vespula pensylvanica]
MVFWKERKKTFVAILFIENKMVVSHRESNISSNIRAIIEQLNLNPVEGRRLIDRTKEDNTVRCKNYQGIQSSVPKITIGVYGCKERIDYELPGSIRSNNYKIDDRSRSKLPEGRQKIPLVPQRSHCKKKENVYRRHSTCNRFRTIAVK